MADKADVLREKLAARDLPTSGTKAEMAARLARADEVPGKVDQLVNEELGLARPDDEVRGFGTKDELKYGSDAT